MSRRIMRAQLPGDAADIVALARIQRSPKRAVRKAWFGAGLVSIALPASLITRDLVFSLLPVLMGVTIVIAAGIEALVIVTRVRCPCCGGRVARDADRCRTCSAPLS
jgi:hypothetical protein